MSLQWVFKLVRQPSTNEPPARLETVGEYAIWEQVKWAVLLVTGHGIDKAYIRSVSERDSLKVNYVGIHQDPRKCVP